MNYAKKISSPVGDLYIVVSETALIALDNRSTELYEEADKKKTNDVLNLTIGQLGEYFQGKRKDFSIPLDAQGTEYQKKVWGALMQIPYGEVWSYGEQAKYLKTPNASRAVGGANGKNPIAIIIPCHRVVGSTGKLTGYAGGLDMKVGLLKLEGHHVDGLQLVENNFLD
jgi:methylated-DNA-[protein]-cysteine S-methyltransferase